MPRSPETPKIPGAPEDVPPKKKSPTPAQMDFREFLKESQLPKERPRPVLDKELREKIEELSEGKVKPDDFEETTKP